MGPTPHHPSLRSLWQYDDHGRFDQCIPINNRKYRPFYSGLFRKTPSSLPPATLICMRMCLTVRPTTRIQKEIHCPSDWWWVGGRIWGLYGLHGQSECQCRGLGTSGCRRGIVGYSLDPTPRRRCSWQYRSRVWGWIFGESCESSFEWAKTAGLCFS
jgi:hypothetical protein